MADVTGMADVAGMPGAPAPAEARLAITTAFPTADGAIAAAIAPTSYAAAPAHGATFGVDRRAPRGAFLWPSATVAALGMTAAGPDSQLSMSVAALELLAAQVVAEIGTYTALSDADRASFGLAESAGSEAPGTSGRSGTGPDRAASPRMPVVTATSPAASGDTAPGATPAGEPAEAEVLGAAAAFVPASRRARFEALYVALSQSPAGAQWSPAARAARALALAGRGESSAVTARERAAAAWDVLPVVFGADGGEASAASQDHGAPSRG